jgi:hypothetical protein
MFVNGEKPFAGDANGWTLTAFFFFDAWLLGEQTWPDTYVAACIRLRRCSCMQLSVHLKPGLKYSAVHASCVCICCSTVAHS